MIRALKTVGVVILLAACGGQTARGDLTSAFEEAGVVLAERELNDGRIAWSSDSDEDVLIEVIQPEADGPITHATVMVPALRGNAEGYPGERYVSVLDDTLVPGLSDWITEEASGRSSGDWKSTREFGDWTATIDNDPDTLGLFSVNLDRGQ